jgi:hypothetical protein
MAPGMHGDLRWRVINAGALALLVGGALFISEHVPRTWISGHVYTCGASTKVQSPGCTPIAKLAVRFASPHGSPSFVAITDSMGAYAVDVVPGQYVVEYQYKQPGDPTNTVRGSGPDDWGFSPLTIGANQHSVRDLRFYSFSE